MAKFKKKVVLAILDGWGLGKEDKFNAIANAQTPNIDRLIRDFPNTQLKSDGLSVGLPEGSTGTSEVNHMTIGAGRVIYQDLPKINNAIETRSFFANPVLNEAIDHALKNKSKLHLIGITSFGGIHSNLNHVFAILELCKERGLTKDVYIHAFTDGRDTPPLDAKEDLQALQNVIDKIGVGKIATLQGRVWLDRDRDFEKTEKAYQLVADSKGIEVDSWADAIDYSYKTYDTCEYFDQYVMDKHAKLKSDDAVFFFHFRSDRMLQLTERIIKEKLSNLFFGSFIECSEELDIRIAFPRDDIRGTLAEAISEGGKAQFHITETEKYPHVTYFLDGSLKIKPKICFPVHEAMLIEPGTAHFLPPKILAPAGIEFKVLELGQKYDL